MPLEEPRQPAPWESLESAADDILVARAVEGDVDAFRILLQRHASLMRAYVTRIVGSTAEADDVVQEAFVIAWSHLPELRERAHVKAWLMRIATRKAFQRVKRRPADVPLPPTLRSGSRSDPEAEAVRSAQLTALGAAIDALPDSQRRCWLLREVGELSYLEVADVTGLTPAQVRGNIARARTSITIRMEGWR